MDEETKEKYRSIVGKNREDPEVDLLLEEILPFKRFGPWMVEESDGTIVGIKFDDGTTFGDVPNIK
jgi:hypothetical protein